MELTVEFLADVLGTDAGQITEAIKDGENFKSPDEVGTFLKQQIEDRIYAAKRQTRDEQYSRGKKEALSAKERELRDKHGLKGETIEEMITELQEAAKVKPDMTPEDVRNTEIFKLEQKKWMDQAKAANEERDNVRTEFKQREVALKVGQKAGELLKKHNFVTPQEIADESVWQELLIQRLQSDAVRLALGEKGELIVQDSNGNQLIDENTVSPVTFDDHFKKVASSMFKVAQSDPRQSPGNAGQAGSGGAGADDKPTIFKDEADFMNKMNETNDPKVSSKLLADWQAQSQGA